MESAREIDSQEAKPVAQSYRGVWLISDYYNGLIKREISAEHALALTIEYQRLIFGQASIDLDAITEHVAKQMNRALERSSAFG